MIRSGAPWVVASEAEGSGRGLEEAVKVREGTGPGRVGRGRLGGCDCRDCWYCC